MTGRPKTRYQSAILRDGAVLLIRHREHATGVAYWLLPGGGIESGETPEATVAREMREGTALTVRVGRLSGLKAFAGQWPSVSSHRAARSPAASGALRCRPSCPVPSLRGP